MKWKSFRTIEGICFPAFFAFVLPLFHWFISKSLIPLCFEQPPWTSSFISPPLSAQSFQRLSGFFFSCFFLSMILAVPAGLLVFFLLQPRDVNTNHESDTNCPHLYTFAVESHGPLLSRGLHNLDHKVSLWFWALKHTPATRKPTL